MLELTTDHKSVGIYAFTSPEAIRRLKECPAGNSDVRRIARLARHSGRHGMRTRSIGPVATHIVVRGSLAC